VKYLIAGLGNIGEDYKDTRHNMGFIVLDAVATASNTSFSDMRYGSVAEIRYKARTFVLLKPSTFMNLSGNAVNYWMKKKNIPVENLLVVVDDISLPFGSFRMRASGGPGGHNGLTHIISVIGTDNFARIRIGIGNSFPEGRQSNYVLGKLTPSEMDLLKGRLTTLKEMVLSFGTIGTELTMTRYNKEGKKIPPEDDTRNQHKN
jgi:PTH1 family peptidyl-tRNA hydrolase